MVAICTMSRPDSEVLDTSSDPKGLKGQTLHYFMLRLALGP